VNRFTGLAGGAALFGGVTILARLAGFARWGVFSGAVGSTATGSAYTAANALPNVLFEVAAGGALAAIAVPLLAGPLAEGQVERASRTASCLMTWAVTVLVPLAGVLALAATPLAEALLDGAVERARPGSTALAADLIRLFALQVPLYGIGVVASGVLQAAKRLFWPAFAPFASSVAVIGVYLAFWWAAGGHQDAPRRLSADAVHLLGWGTTAGVAVLTLPLLIPVARLGIRWRPTYRFEAGERRRAASLAGSGIGALLAQQAATLAVVAVAGWIGGSGALPTFNYAQAVYQLPYAVLAVPLAMSAYPHIAEWAAAGRRDALIGGVAGTTRVVFAVSAGGAALLVAAAPGVQVLFNAIDHSGNAAGLGGAVTWFAPGLLGYGLMAHLQRVLFAVCLDRVAARASAAGWLVAAGCGTVFALAGPGGAAPTVAGLAGGISAGMLVAGAGLLRGIWKALGPGALAGFARSATVALVAALIAGGLGRLVTEAVLDLVISALAGAAPSGVAGALTGAGAAAAGLAVVAGVAASAVWLADRSLLGALPGPSGP
jgi:putative peptidoglycan lipid II flippase